MQEEAPRRVVVTFTIDLASMLTFKRLVEIVQDHVIAKRQNVVFVCADESLAVALNELIEECASKYKIQQPDSNVHFSDTMNKISIELKTERDDEEQFLDGFNVWKERLNMFCVNMIGRDLDALMAEDEAITHSVQTIMRVLVSSYLVGNISAKNRALALSTCHKLVSQLVSVYFGNVLQLPTVFVDSSHLLIAKNGKGRRYLSTLPSDIDLTQQDSHPLYDSKLIIMQGNAAKDASGEACIFSCDTKFGVECTTAAISKILHCHQAEFYMSGYGILTCHLPASSQPIDNARVVKTLNFVEALEIAASTTSEPKIISPLTLKQFQEHDIPVYIKSLHFNKSHPGTFISSMSEADDSSMEVPQVKSICLRLGIIMISIDTINMWHQVGFLSDIFALFKQHNLSVDYVTTSEANITCSLDTIADDVDNTVDRLDRINLLLKDLESMNCRASILGPCSAISLVGRNIRSLLHKLGPIFEIFHSTSAGTNHPIHLISQAHSNVNLSLIIPQIENVSTLITDIHNYLFGKEAKLTSSIGEEWTDLLPQQQTTAYRPKAIEQNHVSGRSVWWRRKANELIHLIEQEKQALYVYDSETVKQRAATLVESLVRDSKTGVINFIFFAIKANPHPEMLKLIESMSFGFECVSTAEMDHVLALFPNLDRKRILFTPNFAPREEYEYGLKLGVNITLDNIYPLEAWPEIFQNSQIFIRVDPGIGKGHHAKVKTAGVNSKFGIPIADFPRLSELIKQTSARIVGLHAHVGSGILTEVKSWRETAQVFLDLCMNGETSELFQHVKTIDLGGGLGVPYRPDDKPLDISQVYFHLHSLLHENKKYNDFIKQREMKFWMEPGRYLSAESGILLARVTQTKKKDANNRYVGLETGMNSLIRPTLYDAYHEIVNLSGLLEQSDAESEFPSSFDNSSTVVKEKYTIVGPICESGDILGEDRWLHKCTTGNVVVVACSGAYGHSMSSFYNNRNPAKQIFI